MHNPPVLGGDRFYFPRFYSSYVHTHTMHPMHFILLMWSHISCILCIFMFEKLINFIKFDQINLITSQFSSALSILPL